MAAISSCRLKIPAFAQPSCCQPENRRKNLGVGNSLYLDCHLIANGETGWSLSARIYRKTSVEIGRVSKCRTGRADHRKGGLRSFAALANAALPEDGSRHSAKVTLPTPSPAQSPYSECRKRACWSNALEGNSETGSRKSLKSWFYVTLTSAPR